MTPAFSRSLLLWLEHGGLVAIPNIRGGGEYGEAWHQGGMLGRKQNSFDDFIAAAEWLIRERYTRPERLAAAGGSNGGLLMGAVLTQRPELFRRRGDPGAAARHAALPPVPDRAAVDPGVRLARRSGGSSAGSARTRPTTTCGRARPIPAVLLATAESDTRVDPMHARKMAARLQAATVVRPAGAAPARGPGGARGGEAALQGARRADRHLDVCVFGGGGRGLADGHRTEEPLLMAYSSRPVASMSHPDRWLAVLAHRRGALLREGGRTPSSAS